MSRSSKLFLTASLVWIIIVIIIVIIVIPIPIPHPGPCQVCGLRKLLEWSVVVLAAASLAMVIRTPTTDLRSDVRGPGSLR